MKYIRVGCHYMKINAVFNEITQLYWQELNMIPANYDKQLPKIYE